MKCPRCGADNAERAEWCYLCESQFTTSGAGEPPAPDERVQPQPPAQGVQAGVVPPGSQAGPPPPPGAAYQAPPPGAYPPTYQPPPTTGGARNLKVIIGILVGVLVVAVAIGAFFLLRGKTYDIDVSAPPGYREAEEDAFREMQESMETEEDDIVLDAVFFDSTGQNFIMVLHEDVLFQDVPSGDDPEEMEQYFLDNEQELSEEFNTSIISSGAGGSMLEEYEVGRLAAGDAYLHMVTSVDMMGATLKLDSMWIFKGDSAFAIVITGVNPRSAEIVEFFEENITFE
jgi:hypothetical protein